MTRVLTQLSARPPARIAGACSDLTLREIRPRDERSLSVRFSVCPRAARDWGTSDPPVPPIHTHPVGGYTEPNLSIPEGATHHG